MNSKALLQPATLGNKSKELPSLLQEYLKHISASISRSICHVKQDELDNHPTNEVKKKNNNICLIRRPTNIMICHREQSSIMVPWWLCYPFFQQALTSIMWIKHSFVLVAACCYWESSRLNIYDEMFTIIQYAG